MNTFIEKIISTSLLKEGVDYEIVSMSLIDIDNDDIHADDIELSLDELIGRSSISFFEEHNIRRDFHKRVMEILGEDFKGLHPSSKVRSDWFYIIGDESKIDFSVALTFGWGIARIIKGNNEGKYMFYNMYPMEDDSISEEDLIKANAEDEYTMMAMYYLYMNKDSDNKKLEKLINEDVAYVYSLITRRHNEVFERFEEIFSSKKGGDNIVEFKRNVEAS